MKPRNEVDVYINGFDEEIRKRLTMIRELGFALVPDAKECIKYGIPTVLHHGNLFHYAGFKNHIGLYPLPSGMEAFREELKSYKQGKGSVQFPHSAPLPLDLIRRIIEFRIADNDKKADGAP